MHLLPTLVLDIIPVTGVVDHIVRAALIRDMQAVLLAINVGGLAGLMVYSIVVTGPKMVSTAFVPVMRDHPVDVSPFNNERRIYVFPV